MLGKRSSHDESEHPYLDHVGRDTFYGFLASHRGELFHDEDFTGLYCSDNGRPSVPPSLLATALLLQAHDGVSDEEAKARADFDLRWKAALGIGLEERPFAKSTLQLFRARLIIHERVRTVFKRSLAFARQTGYFRSRKLKVVVDTSYILGRRGGQTNMASPATTSGPASRGTRRSTGTTPRRGKRSCGAWSPTPTACSGRLARLWSESPQAIPEAGACARRRSCWSGCSRRTLSAGKTVLASSRQ